jgi:CCR4-NOT transcription complex subunit 1
MITFMELIRNPEYRFWSQSIIKSSPEVQKMFETVAKSCLVKIPA